MYMADNITCRICIPFYSEFEEAKKCWQKLLTHGTHIPGRYIYEGIEFEIEPRQGTCIHALRNDLITDYTKTKSTAPLPFDYFFFIDSDVSCKNDIDDVVSLIKKAEKMKCNIIGGPYLKHRTDKYYVWDKDDNFMPRGKGVQPVAMLGTGFMCIARRAFQDLEPPYFYYPKVPGRFYPESEDKNFCKLVGKEIYIDWDIQLYHKQRTVNMYNWDLKRG